MQLCADYMLRHIAKAAIQGFLVSWLHYTISFSPYHQEITNAIQNFLKWNLDIVAESRDFVELDINILIALLQQNDLALKNEFVLFEYAENWCNMRKRQMDLEQTTNSITDEQKTQNVNDMMRSIFIHIRYPMMTPRELAKLLLKTVIKQDAEFFVERIAVGMAYHAGQDDYIVKVRRTSDGALQFTPRMYTSDIYALSMTVPDFENVENYFRFCGCFFSQRNLSEHEDHEGNELMYFELKMLRILSVQRDSFLYHWDLLATFLSFKCIISFTFQIKHYSGTLIFSRGVSAMAKPN